MRNDDWQRPMREYHHLLRRGFPRSLWGKIWSVITTPRHFFRHLPGTDTSGHWLMVSLLILGLIGFSAVRYEDLRASDGLPETQPAGPIPAAPEPEPSSSLVIALKAGGALVVDWLILTLLLAEIPLAAGRHPDLGRNLQVVIWTSIPLALMAGLQVIYYETGGTTGEPGLAGLVDQIRGYDEWSRFVQSLVVSIAGHMTVFWLWRLALVYIGARHALNGKRWIIAFVLCAWIALSFLLPIAGEQLKL